MHIYSPEPRDQQSLHFSEKSKWEFWELRLMWIGLATWKVSDPAARITAKQRQKRGEEQNVTW